MTCCAVVFAQQSQSWIDHFGGWFSDSRRGSSTCNWSAISLVSSAAPDTTATFSAAELVPSAACSTARAISLVAAPCSSTAAAMAEEITDAGDDGIRAMITVAGNPVLAQMKMDHGKMGMAAMPGMTDGEVRKIDKAQAKVTMKHGPITSLDMPGMTMVFTAKDKNLLASVKPGDKVKFMVVNEGGKMVVTDIQPAQ